MSPPLLLTLFSWVWKTSLAAIVLIGLVLLFQWVLGKLLPPRWRYALWLLVVLKLLIPAGPSSHYSIFNLRDALSGPILNSPVSAALPPAQGRSEEPTRPLHPKGEEARLSLRFLTSSAALPANDPRSNGAALLAAASYL